jgi:hypothetical protein
VSFALACLLFALAAGAVADGHVRRPAAPGPDPAARYRCRACGQTVALRGTLRPIRLALLCPADYLAAHRALAPAPGPRPQPKAGARRVLSPGHALLLTLLGAPLPGPGGGGGRGRMG